VTDSPLHEAAYADIAREAYAAAKELHERLWGKSPKLGPHDAVVDVIAGFLAKRAAIERRVVHTHLRAEIEALWRFSPIVNAAEAAMRGDPDAGQYVVRADVLALVDTLTGHTE
jgi:hypothetical protein